MRPTRAAALAAALAQPLPMLRRVLARTPYQGLSRAAVGAAGKDGRMLFRQLADTSAAVGATRSRLAKRALIATAIRAVDPDPNAAGAGAVPEGRHGPHAGRPPHAA